MFPNTFNLLPNGILSSFPLKLIGAAEWRSPETRIPREVENKGLEEERREPVQVIRVRITGNGDK